MTDIDKEIIKTALKNMFDKGWFDICAFDNCVRIACVYPSPELRERLHALHCVHFNAMPQPVREWVLASILDVFNLPPFNVAQEIEQKSSLWSRLLRNGDA